MDYQNMLFSCMNLRHGKYKSWHLTNSPWEYNLYIWARSVAQYMWHNVIFSHLIYWVLCGVLRTATAWIQLTWIVLLQSIYAYMCTHELSPECKNYTIFYHAHIYHAGPVGCYTLCVVWLYHFYSPAVYIFWFSLLNTRLIGQHDSDVCTGMVSGGHYVYVLIHIGVFNELHLQILPADVGIPENALEIQNVRIACSGFHVMLSNATTPSLFPNLEFGDNTPSPCRSPLFF